MFRYLDVKKNGFDYHLYHDPGAPPAFGSEAYSTGFQQVVEWSGLLDPSDGVMIDISPASRGNNILGTNDGNGRDLNPVTGLPYEPQFVPAGDYYRSLAEFWADGPDSETPPGHWFTLANYVMDELQEKRFGGEGEILDNLEYDVKTYLTLGGTVHDSAIAAWGVKGWYDYIRPVSAIRYMCDLGQSSDSGAPSYDPNGIGLNPGWIELITETTAEPGGIHEHLAGESGENIDRVAVRAWRGPDYIDDPDTTAAGVGWILCENWWPYQRPSFVTPPFAGYVSGHSTFSRAAAEVMTRITNDEFFPGGMGTFVAPANEFLVFEDGPSVDITLQWATYRDASDETSISRIYGGIHPTADDIPGRLMGAEIGPDAYDHAQLFFSGDLGILPTVTITTSVDGETFEPGEILELSATALDSENGDLSAMIMWTSSQDGLLGTGSSLAIDTSTLSTGTHTIIAAVTDSKGQTNEVHFQIAIGNQLPTLTIHSPTYDTRVDEGAEIILFASAGDFEDGDISDLIDWTSDVDGLIGTGGSLNIVTLSPGEHTITASVVDSDTNMISASTFVTVYGFVDVEPDEIVLTSSASLDGFVAESSETSNSGGIARSDLVGGGALRIGDFNGDRQVKLITSFDVDVPDGSNITSATLKLRRGAKIRENPFPILGPCYVDVHESGFGGDVGLEASDFEAVATSEQVAMLSEPLVNGDWSSAELNEAGLAALADGETVQFRAACTIDDDDDGLQDSIGYHSGDDPEPENHPQLILSLASPTGNQPPTVTIGSPGDDYRAALGEVVFFDAVAMDDLDGDISSFITWRSSIDGIIGVGAVISPAPLSQGSHIITAEALDGSAVPGRQSIVVHVGVDLTPMFTNATIEAGLGSIPGAFGLAAGDYDNDGCVDLALTPREINQSAMLFRSNCNGTFSDVSGVAGIGTVTTTGQGGSGLAWGDYDNDGYLDLYVAHQSALGVPAELYHNQGDETFLEVAVAAGVNGTSGAVGVVWNDYDGDNDLDLFVAGRYSNNRTDILYQNDGTGHFINVASSVGIAGNNQRSTYMGAWVDFDENLTQELWLSVDFGADIFYRNTGGGVMVDETLLAGIDDTTVHGMGIAVGDPNWDGCLDVLVTNNDGLGIGNPEPSFLHGNNCDGTFSLIGEEAGILSRRAIEWGASFVDFDNDGDEDLSIVAGGFQEGDSNEANVLYLNVSAPSGDLELVDITEAAGVANDANSRGAIWFDFDEDGDMDWLIANSTGVLLFRNDGPTGNFLKVKLAGSVSNGYGVGARVEVTVNGKTMVRYLRAGLSFASAEELEATFGLGDATAVDQITVKWPSGVVDTLGPLSANILLLVHEGLYP
jgi:hypothetical protein